MDSDKMSVDTPKAEEDILDTQRLSSSPPKPQPSEVHVVAGDLKATTAMSIVEGIESSRKKDERMDTGLAGRAESPPSSLRGPPTAPQRPVVEDSGPSSLPSLRSRRASPMEQSTAQGSSDRPLNVTDALTYLDSVKNQFQEQPDVYNRFLEIMKDFKNEHIDTPGVIQRVSHLFNGHPNLIQGFNTFLPAGYRIECSAEGQEAGYITVTTPNGTMTHSTQGPFRTQQPWGPSPSVRPPPPPPSAFSSIEPPSRDIPSHRAASPDPRTWSAEPGQQQQAIGPAVQYVQKIKARCDPETYRKFLDILSQYHNTTDLDEEVVSREIAILFKDDPDLRADFKVFLPINFTDDVGPDKSRRKLDTVVGAMSSAQPLPQKRKRRPVEKEREKEMLANRAPPPPVKKVKAAPPQELAPPSYNPQHVTVVPNSPRRIAQPLPPQLPPPVPRLAGAGDDLQFFERVKAAFQDRNIYNEFLKIVNLFAQDYIDAARLVKESRNFLGDSPLYRQLCDILGWDEKKEREQYLLELDSQSNWSKPAVAFLPELPGRIDLGEKYGSYRRVSASEASIPCSGRDEMCRSVLNDEWVSHPTWTSEDSGFIVHRKNVYEEALHRSEEERHEYDFHIDAIVRTISHLESINNTKIMSLPPEERATFKLKANLGGGWKAIYQRVIKKIYGREAGLEVIQAMQDTPALAIPVVLQRLKQKEEEWKRAQREWNKVWREVDARNYAKSLDHQAISFKNADKKAITAKAFVSQIETARAEQMASRASLIDPLFARTRPRYQLAFAMEDEAILQDGCKLVLAFTDRTQGQTNIEKKRIETFLRTFVPLFFCLDAADFNKSFKVYDVAESDSSDVDVSSVADEQEPPSTSSARTGRGGRKGGNAGGHGDLRKKLLKSEQAKSSRKTRGNENQSPSVSRFASPAFVDEDKAQFALPAQRSTKANNIFFGSTTFYALLRLLQLLYSRLELFKNLSVKIVAEKKEKEKVGRSDKEKEKEGVSTDVDGEALDPSHYYDWMLKSIEDLFDNKIEQAAFEDQMRTVFGVKYAYTIFTVDKVVGQLVKQIREIIADQRSPELLENLKRERTLVNPSTQDHINVRRHAERVLGPDENVFRIDWLTDSRTITFQLIGKDDNLDDSEILTGRWQAYIDSFVSNDTADPLYAGRMRTPYLKRNLPPSVRETQPDTQSRDGLEIKVCVRTYRLFYVPNTEDLMWKHRTKEETDIQRRRLKKRNVARRAWLMKAQLS